MKSPSKKKAKALNTTGLPPAASVLVRDAARCIERSDFKAAHSALMLAMALAPSHPETQRLMGISQARLGHHREAVKSFQAALRSRPDDRDLLLSLAQNQVASNDVAAGVKTLSQLAELDLDPESLFRVAALLDVHGGVDQAMAAAARVLEQEPLHANARILLARTQVANGHLDLAAANYRHLIASKAEQAKAWYGLAEIKTLKLESSELAALRNYCAEMVDEPNAVDTPKLSNEDRISLLYAVGKASEDAAEYPEALSAFVEMGALAKTISTWDANLFEERMVATRKAFAEPVVSQSGGLGHEVIFIVSLPRSGSTLTEQILAAHPQVEGASELPDLNAVIEEESARRRIRFPEWVKDATLADWSRMGKSYLDRTARWRHNKPFFTDKLPENWERIEVALAMLPGARVIECRRDPLETCWSCFKQLFAPGRVAWSYSFPDLAKYWEESRRHATHLVARYPDCVRTQSYEAMLADAETETRNLLEFCGLTFDERCLQFHQATRTVRTASAAQVREPIRQDTRRTDSYGVLLDPLRREIALAAERLADYRA